MKMSLCLCLIPTLVFVLVVPAIGNYVPIVRHRLRPIVLEYNLPKIQYLNKTNPIHSIHSWMGNPTEVEQGPLPLSVSAIRSRRQYPIGHQVGHSSYYKGGLHSLLATDMKSGTTATSTMSPTELQVFNTAFASGRAVGMTKSQATLFGQAMAAGVGPDGVPLGPTVPAMALAFQTALTVGTVQGMSQTNAANFAYSMVLVQKIYGIQSPSTMATFAGAYSSALLVGLQQGMKTERARAFAEAVLRIQADFGAQSVATLTTFAQNYLSIVASGLAQGMTAAQLSTFANVMLQIQARLGTQPLATVTAFAAAYVAAIAEATVQGQSASGAPIAAVISAILPTAGVGDLLTPVSSSVAATPVVDNVKVAKQTDGHGHGSLVDIADTFILNNVGKGALSNLQLLTGGSTINDLANSGLLLGGLTETKKGGLLDSLLQGRARDDQTDTTDTDLLNEVNILAKVACAVTEPKY